MSMKKIVICNTPNYEIVKIENDDGSLILFGLNNQGIILNGKKQKPFIISTISRNAFLKILNYESLTNATIEILCTDEGYELSDDSELYAISMTVLKTVDEFINGDKEKEPIIYDGNCVLLDKFNMYVFKFNNNDTINVPLWVIMALLENKYDTVKMTNPKNGHIHFKIQTILAVEYLVIDFVDEDYKYAIEFSKDYIDFKMANVYRYIKKSINNRNAKFTSMYFAHDSIIIIANCDDCNYYISIGLKDAFDLFCTKNTISGSIQIGHFIHDDIKCEIRSTEDHAIHVVLSLVAPLISFDILSLQKYYELFKTTITDCFIK